MPGTKKVSPKGDSHNDRVIPITRLSLENSANRSNFLAGEDALLADPAFESQPHQLEIAKPEAAKGPEVTLDVLRKDMSSLRRDDRRFLLNFFSRVTHLVATLRDQSPSPR
jgi:hypothetical protein